MPLSWDETKTLMRLKGLVDELLKKIPGATSNSPQRAASNQLAAVVEEIYKVLGSTAPLLADELKRVVGAAGTSFRSVEARGAAIAGWLQATVDAELLQRNAEAAAQAKPESKGPVGFRPPEE
jgi:hypothetical protein